MENLIPGASLVLITAGIQTGVTGQCPKWNHTVLLGAFCKWSMSWEQQEHIHIHSCTDALGVHGVRTAGLGTGNWGQAPDFEDRTP